MPPMSALMVNTKTLAHRGISSGAGHVWVDRWGELGNYKCHEWKDGTHTISGYENYRLFVAIRRYLYTFVVFSIYLRGYYIFYTLLLRRCLRTNEQRYPYERRYLPSSGRRYKYCKQGLQSFRRKNSSNRWRRRAPRLHFSGDQTFARKEAAPSIPSSQLLLDWKGRSDVHRLSFPEGTFHRRPVWCARTNMVGRMCKKCVAVYIWFVPTIEHF